MFIPHTPSETEDMLQTIGAKSISDLFAAIPENLRFPELNLPSRLSEMETLSQAEDISLVNESVKELVCFLGAGAYHHYIPAVVDSLIRRGEFFTAYTPYQPEVSQGTLQSIFEYQSLIAALTGMEVCNASHYDGATATAEAAILAYHNFRGKRKKIVLSSAVNPQYRGTLRTYLRGLEDIEYSGDNCDDPFACSDDLLPQIDSDTALVLVQYPDFFGRIKDLSNVAQAAHEVGALLAVVTNPIALALLKPPSEIGADIVIGEGQPLGIPLSFGGPYLGFFATRKEYLRKIAGRVVGETADENGKRGYVLTLTAREQHIRREKATSNICTNQALVALNALVYLSLLGRNGLQRAALNSYRSAHYLADKLTKLKGCGLHFSGEFFNEFVLECPRPVEEVLQKLKQENIIGGYPLEQHYPELKNSLLLCATELNSQEEMDRLAGKLEEI